MRRISVALAVALPLLVAGPACKLTSRNRVQSINRMNEGIKLEAKNNTSAAERALKESIELDPTHAKAHYTLGQIDRKQNRCYENAVDRVEQIRALHERADDVEGFEIYLADLRHRHRPKTKLIRLLDEVGLNVPAG